MAFQDRLAGLLGNPAFNVGIGLLSAGGPSFTPTNLGQGIAHAMQFASERERAAMENRAMREALLQQQRQQKAEERLQGLLGQSSVVQGPGTQVTSADPLGVNVNVPGRQGLLPTIATSGGQQQLMGLLAQANPQGFSDQLTQGLLGQMFAETEQDPFTRKVAAIEEAIERPLEESEILSLAIPEGTTVNVGTNELDKPFSTTDLNRVRLPDGSELPIGTTPRQAREAGARVFTEAELKQIRDIDGALNTLDTLENLALDPETGVFVDNGGSLLTNNALARFALGVRNGLGSFAGTDASIRRKVYNDTSRGAIASLVRSMGESGALAEGDTARALALIPELGVVPETEKQARAQFAELRKIITRGLENLGGEEAAKTTEVGGWTIREIE